MKTRTPEEYKAMVDRADWKLAYPKPGRPIDAATLEKAAQDYIAALDQVAANKSAGTSPQE